MSARPFSCFDSRVANSRTFAKIDRPLTLLIAGRAKAVWCRGLPGRVELDSDGWPVVRDAGNAEQRWIDLVETADVYLRDSTCETCNGAAQDCGHRGPETPRRGGMAGF